MDDHPDGSPNEQKFQYVESDPIFKLNQANDVANSV